MDKQPRADEDMVCPGVEHPGQHKKERLGPNDNKMQRHQSRRPGLDHPGRNKQQGPPPPGLEHPGTDGGQTPRPGACGTEQGAGAAAPWTGSSEDKRWANATDRIIWGGSSSRSRRTLDWITRGQGAAERHRLKHPGWIRPHEPPHP